MLKSIYQIKQEKEEKPAPVDEAPEPEEYYEDVSWEPDEDAPARLSKNSLSDSNARLTFSSSVTINRSMSTNVIRHKCRTIKYTTMLTA